MSFSQSDCLISVNHALNMFILFLLATTPAPTTAANITANTTISTNTSATTNATTAASNATTATPVPTTKDPALNYQHKVRFIFRGNCSDYFNSSTKASFDAHLRQSIASRISTNMSSLTGFNVSCGSIIVSFTLAQDTNNPLAPTVNQTVTILIVSMLFVLVDLSLQI